MTWKNNNNNIFNISNVYETEIYIPLNKIWIRKLFLYINIFLLYYPLLINKICRDSNFITGLNSFLEFWLDIGNDITWVFYMRSGLLWTGLRASSQPTNLPPPLNPWLKFGRPSPQGHTLHYTRHTIPYICTLQLYPRKTQCTFSIDKTGHYLRKYM